ncbi:MAG: hydrogenase nickel incorporation protein HypB [Gemmatimonadaceae bacterium]
MPVTLIEHREHGARNGKIAAAVRRRLEESGTPAFNLISAAGSGKTALLECTLRALNTEMEIAVVAGACRTRNDADRLARHTGHIVHAVITDSIGHLDASQIERALVSIDLDYTDLLLIENVGNLICPSRWDLGEDSKIVLFSVTEGEDTPLRYRDAFTSADYVVMTKVDLLPHLDFDMRAAVGHLHDLNPRLRLFYTSARTGEGLQDWYDFLRERVAWVRIPPLVTTA